MSLRGEHTKAGHITASDLAIDASAMTMAAKMYTVFILLPSCSLFGILYKSRMLCYCGMMCQQCAVKEQKFREPSGTAHLRYF